MIKNGKPMVKQSWIYGLFHLALGLLSLVVPTAMYLAGGNPTPASCYVKIGFILFGIFEIGTANHIRRLHYRMDPKKHGYFWFSG